MLLRSQSITILPPRGGRLLPALAPPRGVGSGEGGREGCTPPPIPLFLLIPLKPWRFALFPQVAHIAHMWPFQRSSSPAETPRTASLAKRIDDLELDQLELRETQEKTLAAIKRIQGRLLKRVQTAEAELEPGEPNGAPEAIATPADPKAALRQRAAMLRNFR